MIFKKDYTYQAVKHVVQTLDTIYDSRGLYLIEKRLSSCIRSEKEAIIREAHDTSPDVAVHVIINNMTADLLESGHYHLYRGILNPNGDLLFIMFKKSYYMLQKFLPKEYSDEMINENIDVVLHNIKMMG